MPRGRPRTNTVQVTFRLNFDYYEKLKLINPQLTTRDNSGNIKFRHGALGRYLSRLIKQDLDKRNAQFTQEALDPTLPDLHTLVEGGANAINPNQDQDEPE